MRYITGTYALNLPCALGTPGDWHFGAIDWLRVPFAESSESVYGDWGISVQDVPGVGRVPVADHLRATLDLIAAGKFSSAQGMREYFIADERFTQTIFEKVIRLRDARVDLWPAIDDFMGHEYLCDWLDFKERVYATA